MLISNNPKEIEKADKLVLPGVGDFYNCKNQLTEIKGMLEALNDFAHIKQGLFLVFAWNAVNGKKSLKELKGGLGFFDSEVKILPSTIEIKVPHMDGIILN